MTEPSQNLPRTLWAGLILLSGLVGLAVLLSLAERERQSLPVLGYIADFTLTNQEGQLTTLADLTNYVWVADIIFTRCAGPCPHMSAQMKTVQDALLPNSRARLVTLTTDPDYDSPKVLKRYGERFGARFQRWIFLTGTKAQIGSLAASSLKLGSTPVNPADRKNAADLFIHTTIFVLVDKHARLRGIFETGGEDVDWENIVRPSLLADVRRLEREP